MATKIEWCDETWNPVTGCTKISSGCKNCYAEKMAKRLQKMGSINYLNGFKVTLQPHMLDRPRKWKRSRKIFVNSMSDLFHDDVPLEYIKEVFKVMNECDNHTFQVLTKRSNRLKKICNELTWSPNIWMGVSLENEDNLYRVDDLREVPARIRYLSIEPLLGFFIQADLNLSDIHWVIVGGESGPNARPMKIPWVVSIRNYCSVAKVPFFFKQWGGVNKKENGRTLEGKIYSEMPLYLEKVLNGR